MSYLLNIVYATVLLFVSPWLVWRYLRYGKNRRGWTQKLLGFVPRRESARNCIWFHAVSVGEVNLLLPLIERIHQQRPEIEIVVSTTTETGYDLANKKYFGRFGCSSVFFFPFDFTWAIKNALRRVRPSLIVLAELEIWPSFLRVAKDFRVVRAVDEMSLPPKLAVINGRLSDASFRGYQKWRFLLSSSFARLNFVAAQNQAYADRFIAMGCDPEVVFVTGSVKFDGVQTDRQNPATVALARLAEVKPDETVLLAGSTQVEEDLIAAEVYRLIHSEFPKLRLILAPRHPDRVPQLVHALEEMDLSVVRRSTLNSDFSSAINTWPPQSVLVIDVIGELSAWWGVADMAYVGGSLGSRGGQNMIEPAAYGIPVSFGPNTQNFRDVVAHLLAADAATVVADQEQWMQFVRRNLTDPKWASAIGSRAQAEVLLHHGASERTVERLLSMLDEN